MDSEQPSSVVAGMAADLLGVAVLVVALKLSRDWETSSVRLRLLELRDRLGDVAAWAVDRERFKQSMRETLATIETTED